MATLATFTFLVTGTEESREALLSLGITRREMQKMLLTVWMVKLSMEGKLESLWQNMIVPLKTWLPAVEVEDVLTEAAEEEVEDMGVPLQEEAIVMGVDMNAVIAIRKYFHSQKLQNQMFYCGFRFTSLVKISYRVT